MADNMPEIPRDDARPVSLRDDATPHPPALPTAGPQPRPRRWVYVAGFVVAMLFLMACMLVTPLGDFGVNNSDDDSLSEAQVRAIVEEVVGTQIAGASLGSTSGGGASSDEIQALVDDAVGTQVAALVPTSTPIPPTPTVIPPGIAEEDDAFLGAEDAPVVIVEFSDFQCGFCGRWYQETLAQIMEEYPEQVKFVYRDFPIFGDESFQAAMATECAEEQGKFWDYHNRLFDRLLNSEQAPLNQDTLISYAEDLDMDARSFGECLSSERYFDEVVADFQAAQTYGLRGTPGFVINGVVYAIGAQPFAVFDSIIQEELTRLAADS